MTTTDGADLVVDRDAAGSQWRRWDPHVHMPGTALNNRFKNMTVAEALHDLANAEPPVAVAGITDYASTRSFRKAVDAWVPTPENPLKMIFPNVELRLTVQIALTQPAL